MCWFPIVALLAAGLIAPAFMIVRRHRTNEPDDAARLNRVLTISIVVATIAAGVGTILLLGIPGAIFMELANVAFKTQGRDVLRELQDGAWPMALVISMTWPWPLPVAAVRFSRTSPTVPAAVACLLGFAVAALFGVAIAFTLMALS